MEPLPFTLNSPCPKCTGRGTDFRWCESQHAGQARHDTYDRAPEHLDVTCQWCGHTRFMLTADAKLSPVNEINVTEESG